MFDWKRILLVAQREFRVRTGQKSFRASLIIQLVLVALVALSPIIVARFTGGDDEAAGTETYRVLVVEAENDNTGNMLAALLPELTSTEDIVWEVSAAESEQAARDAVENEEADAAMIPRDQDGERAFDIITGDGDPQEALAQTLTIASSALTMQERVDAAGLTPQQQQEVFTAPEVTVTTAASADGEEEEESQGTSLVTYILAYGGTILIFVFVMVYGQWIAQGVVEEKASRIMEIMVNAATPRDLLFGKVLGIMATAILQFVPMLLVGGLIASFQTTIGSWFGVPESDLFDVDFSGIAWSSIGWFTLYFLLGFLLFGALYAGVGSMVSRQEEVGTAVAPMTTIMMVGYFAALASLGAPDGIVARIAYLFPGTSVFVALVRILLGNPEPWEIAVSIIGLVIAIVLAIMFAARLYRVGVLMYGQTPGFKKLFKLDSMQSVAR